MPNKKRLISAFLLFLILFPPITFAQENEPASDTAKTENSVTTTDESTEDIQSEPNTETESQENAEEKPDFTGTQFSLYPANPNSIAPYQFIYELRPGDEITDSFVIKNHGETEQSFRVYPADGYPPEDPNDPTSYPGYSTYGAETKEIGSWIQIEGDTNYTLQGGERKVVNFTVKIPKDTEYGDYIGGFASELFLPGKSVNTALRIMTIIEVKVTDDPKEIPLLNEQTKTTPWLLYGSIAFFILSIIYFIYSSKKTSAKKKKKH